MRVLITGADGFIGSVLSRKLCASHDVTYATRSISSGVVAPSARTVVIGDIAEYQDWNRSLREIDVVVHLAARCHVVKENSADPAYEFRRVNTEATERLALAAAENDIKRFVFLSTASVYGGSEARTPLKEEDAAAPDTCYAQSKFEAEAILRNIEYNSGMPVVILRSPLVYGPGVRGSFMSLLRLTYSGIPLPFGAVRNLRSLIGVGNLAHWLALCIEHPSACGRTFHVSDGEDIELCVLVRTLKGTMNRHPVVLSIPEKLLERVAAVSGLSSSYAKLTKSFRLDSSYIRRTLNSSSPYSLHSGLLQTAHWYVALRRGRLTNAGCGAFPIQLF